MKPNIIEKRLPESTPSATAYSYSLLSNRQKRRDRYFIELRIVHEIEFVSKKSSVREPAFNIPAVATFQNRQNVAEIAFV